MGLDIYFRHMTVQLELHFYHTHIIGTLSTMMAQAPSYIKVNTSTNSDNEIGYVPKNDQLFLSLDTSKPSSSPILAGVSDLSIDHSGFLLPINQNNYSTCSPETRNLDPKTRYKVIMARKSVNEFLDHEQSGQHLMDADLFPEWERLQAKHEEVYQSQCLFIIGICVFTKLLERPPQGSRHLVDFERLGSCRYRVCCGKNNSLCLRDSGGYLPRVY